MNTCCSPFAMHEGTPFSKDSLKRQLRDAWLAMAAQAASGPGVLRPRSWLGSSRRSRAPGRAVGSRWAVRAGLPLGRASGRWPRTRLAVRAGSGTGLQG